MTDYIIHYITGYEVALISLLRSADSMSSSAAHRTVVRTTVRIGIHTVV